MMMMMVVVVVVVVVAQLISLSSYFVPETNLSIYGMCITSLNPQQPFDIDWYYFLQQR